MAGWFDQVRTKSNLLDSPHAQKERNGGRKPSCLDLLRAARDYLEEHHPGKGTKDLAKLIGEIDRPGSGFGSSRRVSFTNLDSAIEGLRKAKSKCCSEPNLPRRVTWNFACRIKAVMVWTRRRK